MSAVTIVHGADFVGRDPGEDDVDDVALSPEMIEALAGLPPTVEALLLAEAETTAQRTYSTGFADLDLLIDGGVKARQLTVIAAPTGSGKSALAVTMAGYFVADTDMTPVLYVSTELDGSEVGARVVAPSMRTTPGEILAHRKDPKNAAAEMRGVPIYVLALDVYETPEPIKLIERKARAIQLVTKKTPIIIVDYTQHLASDDPNGRRMSVSAVASGLVRMARALDAAVIGISSVSRAYYGKAKAATKDTGADEDPRDWLAAAKESGDVEYAAAVFIYLDTSTKVNILGESDARLIVAKSRRGRCGFVGTTFHGPSGLFTANQGAVEKLGSAARKHDDDDKIFAAVQDRKAAGKPAYVKDELRNVVPGVSGTRGDRAIKRLVDDDRLVYQDETRPNRDGRMRGTKVLVVR